MSSVKPVKLLPESQLWPNNIASNLHAGFSDCDLELICDWGLKGHDESLPSKRSLCLYWTAELYSFGRCYRHWLGLHRLIPLPIYGDHGVCICGEPAPHETRSKPQIHLSWYDKRVESLREKIGKKVLHVPHPWILFRRDCNIKKKLNARGTIVFLSHTNDGIEIESYNLKKYIDELKSLPAEYHPLVFCIHRHDVEKKYHLNLRQFGIPIVSAGETSSPYFVERFYSMISRFDFATSNSIGSQLFYCEEFGLPYFLKGLKPTYFNISHPESPPGVLRQDILSQETQQLGEALFSFPPVSSLEKNTYVNRALGLTVNEVDARKQVLRELPREYLAHAPEIASLFLLLPIKLIYRKSKPVALKIKSFLKSFLG